MAASIRCSYVNYCFDFSFLIFFLSEFYSAKNGRPEANVVEPTELSVGRAYKVQWKKSKPNLEELARLYWVEGLTQRQIADFVGVRRATVSEAARKFKKAQFPEP